MATNMEMVNFKVVQIGASGLCLETMHLLKIILSCDFLFALFVFYI